MTQTTPLIAFGFYALTIKQDSIPACSDIQPFVKINDLKTGNVTSRPYITYEPDFWLLDGGYKFKPVDNSFIHVGLMSLSMSGVSGLFSVSPILTIDFTTIHSTEGLTLHFSSYSVDYATDIDIEFYDASNNLIRVNTYFPTGVNFSTGQAVTDFKKIVITFNSTNKAYRYLRLTGIDFGLLTFFTGTDIKFASVVEEVNPLSTEISIDTLDLSLFSSDAAFSIINPSGEYSTLHNKQPLDVYEVVGNDQVYIGQFYLDTWENPSNNEISFHAIDKIGLLESIPYFGGIWITPVNVEDLLAGILTVANIAYDLDSELYGIDVAGWIPVSNYREALQQIAFAVGAYVTCSRGGVLKIYKTVLASALTSYEHTITRAEKGLDQSLTLKPLVTGVEITAHNYIQNAISTQLYNGTLAAGLHTILFNAPMRNLSVAGASISESGANYAILNVATPGAVTLSGLGYDDTTQVKSVNDETLDVNIPRNVLSIKDATLVNSTNMEVVTQRVYDYYQQRYLQKVKLYAPTAEPGKSVLIDVLYDQKISGIVEKMVLDLSGGFTVKAEITGVVI